MSVTSRGVCAERIATRASTLQPLHHVHLDTPGARRASRLNTAAAIAMMAGQMDKASTLYTEAIGANPADPWPYYGKGQVLIAQGKIDDGSSCTRRNCSQG